MYQSAFSGGEEYGENAPKLGWKSILSDVNEARVMPLGPYLDISYGWHKNLVMLFLAGVTRSGRHRNNPPWKIG